ncbi:phosphatase 2C-like domain-containing protein [Pyronema omphalodes]|nr:phosphatase 2C-like domain-containing protein [Pyronema omphalodes]
MRIHGFPSALRTTLITARHQCPPLPRRIPHNAASTSVSASPPASGVRTFFGFSTSKPRAPTHLQQIRNRSNNSSTTSSSLPTQPPNPTSPSPYYFIPSHSLFAKRPPRPFPPPFHTPPTTSFSDPLTSHSLPGRGRSSQGSRDLDPPEGGRHLRGTTNGDDAILTSPHYLAVADGVGAWNTKSHGHAPLWSRLMLHFWSLELCKGKFGFQRPAEEGGVDPVMSLQEAYHETFMATTNAGVRRDQIWQGTTTVCGAVLEGNTVRLVNLGDSVGMIYRPKKKLTEEELREKEKERKPKRSRWGRKEVEEKEEPGWLLRTTEQWHWFDCPRQLGTNSPDTPAGQAVVQEVEVQDGDIFLLATDGLVDNMWDAEILAVIEEVLAEPEEVIEKEAGTGGDAGRMKVLASRIVEQAKKTAMDMFAESPYMERSIDEGLGIEGGKWDDISVVAAVCRKGTPE